MNIELTEAGRRYRLEHIVGYIPTFLSDSDMRSAKEQINERYKHGGGWNTFKGFKKDANDNLQYPGDPKLQPLAKITFRDEVLLIYESGLTVIKQPDGSWEAARLDWG